MHNFSTHKIIGLSTLSRKEHSVAQTREFECTKVVVPQVQARGLLQCLVSKISIAYCSGLRVVEVAHDMQLQVSKFVKNDLKLLNSFDTWHGTFFSMVNKVLRRVHNMMQGIRKLDARIEIISSMFLVSRLGSPQRSVLHHIVNLPLFIP